MHVQGVQHDPPVHLSPELQPHVMVLPHPSAMVPHAPPVSTPHACGVQHEFVATSQTWPPAPQPHVTVPPHPSGTVPQVPAGS